MGPGGGLKVTDIMDEPTVICSGKDVIIIRVIYNPGVRPIEYIHEMGMADCDYLAYRANADPPSLNVLHLQYDLRRHRSTTARAESFFWLCFVLGSWTCSTISASSRPRPTRGRPGWRCWSRHGLGIWTTTWQSIC
jgi:hypothetical protein